VLLQSPQGNDLSEGEKRRNRRAGDDGYSSNFDNGDAASLLLKKIKGEKRQMRWRNSKEGKKSLEGKCCVNTFLLIPWRNKGKDREKKELTLKKN